MNDYSLEIPEIQEMIDEPKHSGRLGMLRRLRALSGSMINALERIENWTEYMFGTHGKAVTCQFTSFSYNVQGSNLSQGIHVINVIIPNIHGVAVSCAITTPSNIPSASNVVYLGFGMSHNSPETGIAMLRITNETDVQPFLLSFSITMLY